MKKLLIFTIVLPILAYILIPLGNYFPDGLLVVLYSVLIAAAMVITAAVTIRHPKSQGQWILTATGVALYLVVLAGLIDILLTTFDGGPFIMNNGSAWADIGAIVAWTVIFIPLAYIVGSVFLVIDFHLARQNARKK